MGKRIKKIDRKTSTDMYGKQIIKITCSIASCLQKSHRNLSYVLYYLGNRGLTRRAPLSNRVATLLVDEPGILTPGTTPRGG